MSNDLISRQAALDAKNIVHIEMFGRVFPVVEVATLKGLRPVDAVPVVRCKDCMHYGFTDNRIPEEQIWWCYFWDDVRSPDAYCSDGEREDDDHEKAD